MSSDHSGELEDERGVDVAAIRELLRLSPAERVDRLVDTVNTWSEIFDHASPGRLVE